MTTKKIEKAKKLRQTIEKLAQNLSDNDSLENIELFPTWKQEQQYQAGYKVRFNESLYKVIKHHYSTLEKQPTSENGAIYFQKVYYIEPDTPQPWEKPTQSNPYSMGISVIYNNKIYKSLINNNMWNPEEFPLAWEEIQS